MKFRPHKCGGLTLIEVMVALLVLSVGLVGVAALNIASVSSAHSSYYRGLASFMAIDAEERLWLHLGTNGMISSTDLNGIASDWRATWSGYLPVDADTEWSIVDAGSPSTFWMDVNVRVEWVEQRFMPRDDMDNDDMETFVYRSRILQGAPL